MTQVDARWWKLTFMLYSYMGRLILRETIQPSVSTEKHSQGAMFSFISTCFLTADNIILSTDIKEIQMLSSIKYITSNLENAPLDLRMSGFKFEDLMYDLITKELKTPLQIGCGDN